MEEKGRNRIPNKKHPICTMWIKIAPKEFGYAILQSTDFFFGFIQILVPSALSLAHVCLSISVPIIP